MGFGGVMPSPVSEVEVGTAPPSAECVADVPATWANSVDATVSVYGPVPVTELTVNNSCAAPMSSTKTSCAVGAGPATDVYVSDVAPASAAAIVPVFAALPLSSTFSLLF